VQSTHFLFHVRFSSHSAKNEESRAFVTTYQGTHAKDQDKEYPFLDAPDVDQDSDSDSDEEMEDAEDDDHSMQKVSAQEARAKLQERARKRKRNEVISDDEDQQDSENKEEDEDQGKGRNEWDSDEDEDLTKGILNDRIAVKRAEKNVIAKKNAYLNNNPKTITADDDEEVSVQIDLGKKVESESTLPNTFADWLVSISHSPRLASRIQSSDF